MCDTSDPRKRWADVEGRGELRWGGLDPAILAIRSSRRMPCFFRDFAHLIIS